jgi:hypothetical protein
MSPLYEQSLHSRIDALNVVIEAQTALINDLRRIVIGGLSSPNWPDNAPALVDEIGQTLEVGIWQREPRS